ncbi:unnamed protein product [Haemonchus placei]|uniref:ATP-dependent DNA helicase n=1 Tax=Haemonchus placei TaxID=6290 RepID=A0A0N4WD32_HAEPC|nr:unnamed protein product [Haemonchus placei]
MRAREPGIEWNEGLLEIDNDDCNDVDGCVQVPEDMFCDSDIVREIFRTALHPSNTSELCERAILAPKNVHVQSLNDVTLDALKM